ncbi:hypothetical protein QTP88_005666 [Uroleucon formosanum]
MLAARATTSRRHGIVRRQLFPANKTTIVRSDPSYGNYAEKPDMAEDDFEAKKEKILSSLILIEEERAVLERETVDQSLSNKWIERRRKMFTASNFGKIMKMRQTTASEFSSKSFVWWRREVTTTAMDIDIAAMDDGSEITSRECRDRSILRDFISEYKQLPELWDVRCKDNFGKELKKINDSKRSGAGTDDFYQPSSWLFEELSFLTDLEKPTKSVCSIDDKVENRDEEIKVPNNDSSEAIQHTENAVPTFIRPSPKISKSTISQQNELLSLACNYLSKEENIQDSDLDQAKVWANTLKTLTPNQKVFAQKAINDILFEAQLGTLHRNSVKINGEDCTRTSTPMTVNSWNKSSIDTTQSQDYVLTQTNLQNFYGNWNGSDV